MAGVLGIDVGGSNFRIGLFDQEGHRLDLSEGKTDSSGGRDWMLSEIRQRSLSLIEKAELQVKACGISFGGPVDYDQQQVSSMHVSGWQGFKLARWVKEHLNLDCLVDNDANAGALGEFRYGAGRGTHSIVYITISTGIGGGVVCEGKLLHGRDSLAGELGHIPMSVAGAVCSCGGQGCLETFCSGTAIALRGRGLAKRKPAVLARTIELSSGDPDKITAETLFQAATEGEKGAVFIVREAAQWLARGLLMVIRILNPDRIILGGGVALAGKRLLDPLHEYLDILSIPMLQYSTEIALAELGNYSPLYGAAALGWELV
ncbi:MAG: ROK family protein [Acidobacteria bacterium]|nr:ROK family protein [Acidobacteriota bacterium]